MPEKNTVVSQRFTVLDSFRGLCALSVVVFHLHIWNSFTELSFFRSAGLFVEFFFTLSGFVLCHGYAQQVFDRLRLKSFLIGRGFRLFPLHWALLGIFTLLECCKWLAPWLGLALGRAFAGSNSLGQWLPNLLLLQAWLPRANLFSFNGPAWSISVEFYLYLVFALILFVFTRQRKGIFLLIALVCSACVYLDMDWISKSAFRGTTCFFLGALAYEAYRRMRHWTIPRWGFSVLEFAALLGLFFCLTLQYEHKSYWASCFFALFILLFAYEGGVISQQLRRKVFVHLGHWSFSIYLCHYVLIAVIGQLVQVLEDSTGDWLTTRYSADGNLLYLDTGNLAGNQMLGVAILAVVLVLSSLSYRFIELRGINWGKRMGAQSGRRVVQASGQEAGVSARP